MTKCNHDEFECRDEQDQCISSYVVCDGSNDCDNGRDEQDHLCKCDERQVSCSMFILCPHTDLGCCPLSVLLHTPSQHPQILLSN